VERAVPVLEDVHAHAPSVVRCLSHPATGHVSYRAPEVLQVSDVERPRPDEDEVLVSVCASSVTRGDAMRLRHTEYRLIRLLGGIRQPRQVRTGMEFAGTVEQAGTAGTEFRVGDEVFRRKVGANAAYVAVRESGAIAKKPTPLTFEEAAAVPDDSLLAISCLRPG